MTQTSPQFWLCYNCRTLVPMGVAHSCSSGTPVPAPTTVPPWPADLIQALTDRTTAAERRVAELEEALNELNKLRSNVIATQSAGWSNQIYPMVAILNRAGFEVDRDVPTEDKAMHLVAYGGAGGTPSHPKPGATESKTYRDHVAALAKEDK